MSAVPLSPGDVIADKYVVERVVAEGGMGIVLAAYHRELDIRVAIKVLQPEIAEQPVAAERFRREARAAARVRGLHSCRVLDVGVLDNGVPYLVMDYLDGHDLAAELKQRGSLPPDEAIDYLLQACEAMSEAHAAGVIHRDLKPANLFVETCGDGSKRIKVLDFGVSKSVRDATLSTGRLTRTVNLIGSPLYMSPEQLDAAREVDVRTDVWSLAVVLCELITGRPPFVGESLAQLVKRILHDQPDALSELPPELQTVLSRALEKQSSARYATVAEFRHALEPFAGQHVTTPGPQISKSPAATSPKTLAGGFGVDPTAAPSDQPHDPARAPGGHDRVKTPLTWSRPSDPGSGSSKRMTMVLLIAGLGLALVGWTVWRSSTAKPGVTANGTPTRSTPARPSPGAAIKPTQAQANAPARHATTIQSATDNAVELPPASPANAEPALPVAPQEPRLEPSSALEAPAVGHEAAAPHQPPSAANPSTHAQHESTAPHHAAGTTRPADRPGTAAASSRTTQITDFGGRR